MQYETVLYDHLEYLRMRNQEYLRDMQKLEEYSDGWWAMKNYLDGVRMSMWVLEDSLLTAGLPLNRP